MFSSSSFPLPFEIHKKCFAWARATCAIHWFRSGDFSFFFFFRSLSLPGNVFPLILHSFFPLFFIVNSRKKCNPFNYSKKTQFIILASICSHIFFLIRCVFSLPFHQIKYISRLLANETNGVNFQDFQHSTT